MAKWEMPTDEELDKLPEEPTSAKWDMPTDEELAAVEDVPVATPQTPNIAQEIRDLFSGRKLETAATAASQGATMGAGEELGAGVATGIEALADLIPNEDDNKIKELKKKGFKFPEEDLLSTYQQYRDAERRRIAELQKLHPDLYTTTELGTGLALGLATGGAGAARAGAKALASTVGKKNALQMLKSLSTPISKGAAAGAAGGAATSAGLSESDLTEGQVAEFLGDTATGGLVGAGVGGGLPIAAKGAKYVGGKAKEAGLGALKVLGFDDAIKLGQEAYDANKVFTKEEMNDIAYQEATKLYDRMQEVFGTSTANKKAIKDMAEELQLRVDAGEDFVTAKAAAEQKLAGVLDLEDRAAIGKQIDTLEQYINPQALAMKPAQEAAEKAQIQAQLSGKPVDIEVGQVDNRPVVAKTITTPSAEKTTARVFNEMPEISTKIDNMSLPELENALASIDEKLKTPNKLTDSVYFDLRAKLVDKRNTLMNQANLTGIKSPYETQHQLFKAQEDIGLSKFGGLSQEDKLREPLKVMKYFGLEGGVADKAKDITAQSLAKAGNFTDELARTRKYVDLSNYMYEMSAEKGAASTPGMARKIASVAFQAVPVAVKRMENLIDVSPERISAVAPEFAPVIERIRNATGQKRTALIFSLTSNPAFRAKTQPLIDEDEQNGQ